MTTQGLYKECQKIVESQRKAQVSIRNAVFALKGRLDAATTPENYIEVHKHYTKALQQVRTVHDPTPTVAGDTVSVVGWSMNDLKQVSANFRGGATSLTNIVIADKNNDTFRSKILDEVINDSITGGTGDDTTTKLVHAVTGVRDFTVSGDINITNYNALSK
jgi:hypothetical protein